jgi:hypothetical protein
MADVTPHPLTAEAAQALQGVTNLAADCELAAKVMAETGTFETGQAILKEAAAALTALSEQNASFWTANLRLQRERDALTAQVTELTRERDGWRAQHDRLLAESAKCFDAQSEIDQAWDAIGTAGNKQILTLPEQISALCRDYDARAEAAEDKVARLLDANWRLRSYAVHDDKCTVNKPPHFDVTKCSCGLRAALTEGTPE